MTSKVRLGLAGVTAAILAAACVLPRGEVDPSLDRPADAGFGGTAGNDAAAGTGGADAAAGSGDTAGSAGADADASGALEAAQASPPVLVAANAAPPVDGQTVTTQSLVGIVPGDLLITSIYIGEGGEGATVTDAQGWALEGPYAPQSCGGFLVLYGHRVVQGDEPGSYGFKFDSPAPMKQTTVLQLAYRGVDETHPIVASQAKGLPSNADFTLPQLMVSVGNTTLLAIYGNGFNAAGSWEPPSGMNEVFDNGILGAFDATQAIAGMSLQGKAAASNGGCATVFVAALKAR